MSEELSKRIDDLHKRFDDLRADMAARFSASDKRVDDLRADMNARFSALEGRFEGRPEGRFTGVDKRIDDLRDDMKRGLARRGLPAVTPPCALGTQRLTPRESRRLWDVASDVLTGCGGAVSGRCRSTRRSPGRSGGRE